MSGKRLPTIVALRLRPDVEAAIKAGEGKFTPVRYDVFDRTTGEPLLEDEAPVDIAAWLRLSGYRDTGFPGVWSLS